MGGGLPSRGIAPQSSSVSFWRISSLLRKNAPEETTGSPFASPETITWRSPDARPSLVDGRAGLIAYYERKGYALTGERRPFPMQDERFGLPQRELEFVVLAKALA